MTSSTIRVSDIAKGSNPRRYFDPKKMLEMEESIRAQNLLTPILVRPIVGGRFELIAGERRLRSFIAVFGENSDIPALVREMSDEEARAAALTENTERAAMTYVEEAEAAAKVLGDCGGSRQDAAKRLGWELDTLNKRLALMYASEKVREALQEQHIHLGHAELLAGCRKESQDEAIALLLAQPKKMTVAELKAYLEANAQHLDRAIFNKEDCAACHHSSANQSALFSEAIKGGRCTNKQCFETKTEAELSIRAEALKEEFQVVRIVRAGENLTLIPLVTDGPKGVGTEQAVACKTCQHFGAVVSAVPDKLGNVYKSMCMDVPCNTGHVKARAKEHEDAVKATEKAAGKAAQATKNAPVDSVGEKSLSASPEKVTKSIATSEPSNRIKEYREKIWREMYARAIPKLPVKQNRTVLLALCLTRPGVLDSSNLKKATKVLMGDVGFSAKQGELLQTITKLDDANFAAALSAIAAHVSSGSMGLELKDVTDTLKFYDIKVESYWKIGKTFCDLLTKAELDAICEETGIKAAIGESYKKSYNGSKEEFVNAVLNVKDFEYVGKIPKLMRF